MPEALRAACCLQKGEITIGFFCRQESHDISGPIRTGVIGPLRATAGHLSHKAIKETILSVISSVNLAHFPPK